MTTSPSNSTPIVAGATILVVGGRGFVGSRLVRQLVAGGYRVHVFGPAMDVELLADLRGSFQETVGSVEDRADIAAVLERIRPAAVVNCAAFGAGNAGLMRSGEADADRAFAVNVDGFRRLIEAAAASGSPRVVWTGSTVVYGPASDYAESRVDEFAAKAPRTIYGLTKHLSEEIAASLGARLGIDIICLRLPLVLGPGRWYQGAAAALMELFSAAGSGRDFELAFQAAPVDLMHVDDAARALQVAVEAEAPARRVYNVNGFTASAADIVREVVHRRPDARIHLSPQSSAMSFPLISDACFRAEFGFTPHYDLAALVADMLR